MFIFISLISYSLGFILLVLKNKYIFLKTEVQPNNYILSYLQCCRVDTC